MRRTTLLAAGAGALLAGCSVDPGDSLPDQPAAQGSGVPGAFYDAVEDALAEEPDVGSMALLESGGPCPLRDEVTLDGERVDDVSAHGVVRLGGEVPAVVCEWYEDTPVQVLVGWADDEADYTALREASAPTDDIAVQEQSGQQVTVGERTIDVLRIEYVTNPAAGTDFIASYWDDGAYGLVRLEVSDSDARSEDYDEQQVATDLAAFLDG